MKFKGLKSGWYTVCGELWEKYDATYYLIPYDKLPVLDESLFHGNFNWLTDLRSEIKERYDNISLYSDRNNLKHLDRILNFASAMNINLPISFQKFLTDFHLQKRIPICTDCWLEVSNENIALPENNDCYLVRFLNDQQGVLLWYLCFNKASAHCVIVSSYYFEKELQYSVYNKELDNSELLRNAFYCAPSFEEFLYRFWIENTLWFDLNENLPLTETENKYLEEVRNKMNGKI